MFWTFMIVLVVAAGLFNLGVYSVWVGILSFVLRVAVVLVIGLGIAALWKRLRRTA